ncbi:OmpA family protein [Hymenobacter rubripertinctus]|uniref:OmpA family protein n=1 Tax=Hymenobacter rubripertinctus TaxID=2029981 RepID=UPI001603526F|nr:OmpA family protein [Hymenobacter rubripertinctus]
MALYVNFDTDKATIRPESEPTVAEVATLLRQNPTLRLAVQGHTDNAGTAAHNQPLSEARAGAVVAFLRAAGIAAERLQAAGFGQTQPLTANTTEAGRAQNRRVELVKR